MAEVVFMETDWMLGKSNFKKSFASFGEFFHANLASNDLPNVNEYLSVCSIVIQHTERYNLVCCIDV